MGIINREQLEELFKSRDQLERNYVGVPGGGRRRQESI